MAKRGDGEGRFMSYFAPKPGKRRTRAVTYHANGAKTEHVQPGLMPSIRKIRSVMEETASKPFTYHDR